MTRLTGVVAGVFLCASGLFGAYSYTVSQDLTASGWNSGWSVSGNLHQGMSGIGTMTYQNQTGFNVVNMTIRPDPSAPYANYSQYLGDFQVEVVNWGGGFGQVYLVNTSTNTTLASAGIALHDNMIVRTVVNNATLGVFSDNVMVLSYGGVYVPSYLPAALGMYSLTGTTDAITHVDLGFADTVGPTAIPSSSIGKSAYTNHVDLQWPAASDPYGVREFDGPERDQRLGTDDARGIQRGHQPDNR